MSGFSQEVTEKIGPEPLALLFFSWVAIGGGNDPTPEPDGSAHLSGFLVPVAQLGSQARPALCIAQRRFLHFLC